jgi:prepilin-type N-terminal cleavage/methylation domain-containing protein
MILTRKKAFTLIELLVVISIIALLMAIIMPALNKARAQARKVVCGSNFRQLGSVYHMYANDHRQWIPRFVPKSQQDKTFTLGKEVSNVLPYALSDPMYQLLRNSYKLKPEFLVCPTKIKSRGSDVTYFRKDGEIELGDPEGGYWMPYRWIGIARLNGLVNMTNTIPKTVEESAARIDDPSWKLLAADENVVWNMNLEFHRTRLAHKGRGGLPEGANRLHVDGSVNWVNTSMMAADDKPLDTADGYPTGVDPSKSPPRYDHRGDYTRMYYW